MTHRDTLVFLATVEDVDHLSRGSPELLRRAQAVSLDPDVSVHLQEEGVPFREQWDLLQAHEYALILRQSLHLMETWFLPWEARLRHRGHSLPRLQYERWFGFFRETLCARYLFDRALAKGTRRIVTFRPLWRPDEGLETTPAMAAAVWRFMAERHRLEVVEIPPDSARRSGRAANPSPSPIARAARSSLRALASPFQPPIMRAVLRRLFMGGAGPVLLYCAAGEAPRFSRLFAEISRALGMDAVALTSCLSFHPPSRAPAGEVRFRVPPFPAAGLTYSRVRRRLRDVFELWPRARVAYRGPWPEIFANPHLDPYFRTWFIHRWPVAAEALEQHRWTLRALQPSCLILTAEDIAHQRGLMACARTARIPVITIPHSGTHSTWVADLPADIDFVWCGAYRDYLHLSGKGAPRQRVVQLPPSVIGFRPSRLAPGEAAGLRLRLDIPAGARVVLALTSGAGSGIFPYLDFHAHRASLATLLNVPEPLRGRVVVVLKANPAYDHRLLYRHLARPAAPGTVRILQNSDFRLDDLLAISDASAVVNVPTTATVGPLLTGVPLVSIRTTEYRFVQAVPAIPAAHPPGRRWASVVSEDAEIWPTLERTMEDPLFRARVLEENREFRESLVPSPAPPLVGEIVRTVHGLARERGPHRP